MPHHRLSVRGCFEPMSNCVASYAAPPPSGCCHVASGSTCFKRDPRFDWVVQTQFFILMSDGSGFPCGVPLRIAQSSICSLHFEFRGLDFATPGTMAALSIVVGVQEYIQATVSFEGICCRFLGFTLASKPLKWACLMS